MAKYGPIDSDIVPIEELDHVSESTDVPTGPAVDQEATESDPSGNEISQEGSEEAPEGEETVEEGTDSPVVVEPVVKPFQLPPRHLIKDLRRRDKTGRRTCGACGVSLQVTEFRRAHDEYCIDCKEKHNL